MSKTYTEIQVMRKLLKILDKYPGKLPTPEQICQECKDSDLSGQVYLMLVNELMAQQISEAINKGEIK
jgi:hypothetical protein